MDNGDIQLVGGPCGQHGPYTFYKAFKYTKNGIKRIVTLSEFFFVKLWIDSDLLCIGELQLLWSDKNSDQVLASLRLYFLPENTPEGRLDHGEDEVLAISEKVVLRVEDLITWITVDAEWTWGRLAKCEREVKDPPKSEDNKNVIGSLTESSLDFSDVEKERKASDCQPEVEAPLVVILSYPRYCRYRAMMSRLEGVENEYLKYTLVNALGGFTACTENTRILFCKETFDYPELEDHELLCNHLAPKLKGRPRGKRKKRSVSPGSESNESESSISNVFNSSKERITPESGRNGLRCDSAQLRRSARAVENTETKEFMKELTAFMKTNYTPIGKIPSLGYKELDLYSFYAKVQKLGGYDAVTTNRLWKSIFDDMSGHASSTSAATVIRRHYERFLLPYERHLKGEEYKPLPVSERRRLKSKAGSSASDADSSESTSRSGNSTPIPGQAAVSPVAPTTPIENKEFNMQIKFEAKPSSLRSVRVKPERQKDKPSNSDQLGPPEANNNNDPSSPETRLETSEEVPKPEPSPTKAELPEKDAEPLTSAVAPMAQKVAPEKSPSPLEGKENIPLPKTGDTPKSPEVVEVPHTPKTPEVVDLVSDTLVPTKLHQPYLHETKKRKLEILKEGGLEVTPVRNFKDVRPSVIQPTGASVASTWSEMGPPASALPPKRALNISPIRTEQNPIGKSSQKFPLVNGGLPPKVLQSRSIYSYSEKTVYGNPKDYMMTPSHPVHVPKVAPRQSGGDILDLTVGSPQKPAVETIRAPIATPPMSPFTPSRYHYRTGPALLEGRRLGSNLEITLVGSNNKAPQLPRYNPNMGAPNYPHPHYPHQKRPAAMETYPNHKMARMDNGKVQKAPIGGIPVLPTSAKNNMPVPQMAYDPRTLVARAPKVAPSVPKPYQMPNTPPMSLPPMYDPSKAYLSPFMDPNMYYNAAIQSMYSHGPLNSTPPMMAFPTQEQLKMYTELMNSRMSFPYSMGPDWTNPSVNGGFKKP